MFDHHGPEMTLELARAALVLTDLQNDFLSPTGKAYALIKDSLRENNTAENLEILLKMAPRVGMRVFISPHYYYPHDHQWRAPVTPLEDLAHKLGLVQRSDPLSVDGFDGSGADFPARYKPYLGLPRPLVALCTVIAACWWFSGIPSVTDIRGAACLIWGLPHCLKPWDPAAGTHFVQALMVLALVAALVLLSKLVRAPRLRRS